MRYDEARPEMLPFIPTGTTRLLDVGCDTGRFATQLRAYVPSAELWGIDPEPVAEASDDPYDRRICGLYPDDLPEAEPFDCIVFNDVLEHMVDPWEVVSRCREHLSSAGVVVASIPNVRNVKVLRPLVFRGEWQYEDSGLLDRTHLRFFTRSTATELFTDNGYDIEQVVPIRMQAETGKLGRLNQMLGGRLDELFTERFAVVARPRTR
jgi:2-polyprenyl-3-methyl-5-hydroxy-6-metoxy-1,4-benzoquinol methylase